MTDPRTITDLDATAQAELVRTGAASPSELVEAALARLDEVNPALNAVIHDLRDRARVEAAAGGADGPFRGVPFVVKDLDGTLGGAPFHQGNRLLKAIGHTAERDSTLIARLRGAGLVAIGKTNTPEFGLQPTTEPEAYGPTHNPWDLARGPGGSSGGSGAAVAARVVPIGHAGDGGGSIRIPASANGLVGLKPCRGRISLGPDEGEPWNGFVARGVLTRSVRDTAAILDAVHGAVPGDPSAAPGRHGSYVDAAATDPAPLRIGLLTSAPAGMAATMPACVAAAEAAAHTLEGLGHHVEVAAPAALDEGLISNFITVLATNVAVDLEELAAIAGRPVTADDVEAITWTYNEMGRAMTGVRVQQALREVHAWTRRMLAWWEDFDILLTPTLAEVPPMLGDLARPDDPGTAVGRATPFVAYCAPFNVTGQPAISVPTAMSPEGLPVGVQAVAGAWREDRCLAIAGQLERAMPWADRRPGAV
ncbi:MAG: amidase [Actinomycetes bacterium]